MYTVNAIWQVETETHVFEYNLSETVNVYEASAARDSTDVDVWSKRYDSRDDFSRDCSLWLGEIQQGAWIVVENTSGYMPDSEPEAFAEYSDALNYLCEQLREWAQHDDEQWDMIRTPHDEQPSSEACADSIISDLEDSQPELEGQQLTYVVNPNSPGDLPRAFELTYDPDCEVNICDIA